MLFNLKYIFCRVFYNYNMRFLIVFILVFLTPILVFSQNTGTISGKVVDAKRNETLIGVTIVVKGANYATQTNSDGIFNLKNIKAGEYNIEIKYLGFKTVLKTEVKVIAGKITNIGTIEMVVASTNMDEVVIIGKKPLIDVDKPQTINTISQDNIDLAPSRQLQQIVNTQPGVVQSPAGVNIRGGRTYETGTYIDGVNVTDPLAGTGFGLDIGSNAISEIEITTGGIGAEVGDATAGVISTKTKRGGDKFEVNASYKRDDFGFNKNSRANWNSQVTEINLSGPFLKKTLKNKVKFSLALRNSFSDEFYKNPANQVVSSLYSNTNWTPFQDNRWSAFLKVNYDLKNNKKFTFSLLRSITVNQDVNLLRIFGNDVPFQPGFQYNFSKQMDNANTFTHDAYMQVINYKQSVNKRFSYDVTASRFFVQLRADANGRDWRPANVDQEFDANSINLFPTTVFIPTSGKDVRFVQLADGFFNNNGIASLWHHHYLEEYVLKSQGNVYSKNSLNKLSFGFELKFQEMLWIDIVRPWIGAPIKLSDGSQSQSFRLGQQSDVWKVNPQRGGFYITDQIKYKGLVASIGGRFEYWAPGRYIDDAVADNRSPIRDEIREDYLAFTTNIGGLNYKFRFLPKISASFPIAENKMLYFNYGHTTILPHPSFIYPGLNPLYQDRSTAAAVGNPNLNPEVDISYEIGLRSQLTNNDALTISAFWKDKYDFVTTASVIVKDITGREITRTIRINSDFARSRGLEVGYIKRIGTWYQGQVSLAYMVTTGQSASANEKLKELLASGAIEDTKEYYLPWDVPLDFKSNHIFKIMRKKGLFNKKWLNNMSFYFETVTRSGIRYTPSIFARNDLQTGRPIYVSDPNPDARWSKIGEYWFWADFTFTKYVKIKKLNLSYNIQITNIFDNQNSAIVNPVTGAAFQNGDNVPENWTDPRFIDPRLGNGGPPPSNPARFLQQRHIMLGFSLKF